MRIYVLFLLICSTAFSGTFDSLAKIEASPQELDSIIEKFSHKTFLLEPKDGGNFCELRAALMAYVKREAANDAGLKPLLLYSYILNFRQHPEIISKILQQKDEVFISQKLKKFNKEIRSKILPNYVKELNEILGKNGLSLRLRLTQTGMVNIESGLENKADVVKALLTKTKIPILVLINPSCPTRADSLDFSPLRGRAVPYYFNEIKERWLPGENIDFSNIDQPFIIMRLGTAELSNNSVTIINKFDENNFDPLTFLYLFVSSYSRNIPLLLDNIFLHHVSYMEPGKREQNFILDNIYYFEVTKNLRNKLLDKTIEFAPSNLEIDLNTFVTEPEVALRKTVHLGLDGISYGLILNYTNYNLNAPSLEKSILFAHIQICDLVTPEELDGLTEDEIRLKINNFQSELQHYYITSKFKDLKNLFNNLNLHTQTEVPISIFHAQHFLNMGLSKEFFKSFLDEEALQVECYFFEVLDERLNRANSPDGNNLVTVTLGFKFWQAGA